MFLMSRAEKINFLIMAVREIEGVEVPFNYFDNYTDEKINEEAEFYDYLLDK